MKRCDHRFLLMLLLAFFVHSSLAFAGTTGKISGVVREKDTRNPLPGVNVIVLGTTLGAATDANGRYFILHVPPGTYSVKASSMGYQATTISNVKVSVDLTSTVNFDLASTVLETGEAVEIVAQRPLIQKDGVTTMQVVEADVVENMVADDFKDVLTLNSGVTTRPIRDAAFAEGLDTGEGQFFVRGGRGNELAVMVDGMSVRDGITGGLGGEVSTGAIEEIQLISGNFNAEYGNAMSGVLNLVTQEGGSKTNFSLRGLTDAIFGTPTRDYTFQERDRLIETKGVLDRANWGTYQSQFSLGGPVPGIGNTMKYFLAGEYYQTDGNIGILQNEFTRRGSAKVTLSPTKTAKLTFSANANSEDQEIYDHYFAHQGLYRQRVGTDSLDNNFAGNDHLRTRTYQGIVAWTQTLNQRSFFELKIQHFSRTFMDRVRSQPEDYIFLTYNAGEDFVVSGDDPRFLHQEDRVWQGKFDVTYQANINHNIKAGLDFNRHRVWRQQLLTGGDIVNSRVDMFKFYPVEAAAYLQDKMEFNDLVINVGLRVDYFDPKDSVAVDVNNPLGPRRVTESKIRVSPRLGLAHPITDRANLHFSYGHFYQVPEYNKIVFNHNRYVDIFRPTLGNADLEPQKTVAFEVGWDQQITDFLALSVTGFYKDIENLVATDLYSFARPSAVTYYINQDFANSRGVEINFRTRRYHHFASYFSYTISRAEGNSSNPLDTRADLLARPPRVPLKKLVILDWDRPHVFNFNFDFRYKKGEGPRFGGAQLLQNFGVNLTGRFSSGQPYTPTDSRGQRLGDENVARMPSNWQLDLRVDKLFNLAGREFGVFTEVTNLTNRRNVVEVFTDTGLPNETTDPGYTPQGKRDPYNIGAQRNIRLGFELNM
ncbi:carboxypeptidase-like regulatory domain-containing protein [bacterium]|nr:carboxypeptidase-like regulatory domain-containing protein [bacterium]